MLLSTDFDPADADQIIAEARATFDRDPSSLGAVELASFELWARPDQLARAAGQPAIAKPVQAAVAPAAPAPMRRAKPPTVFSSFGASPPKMSEAEARKLLLTEIAQRRGGAVAHRCRHMTVDQLAAVLGSPKATRSQISASWDRAFKRVGAQID